MGGTAGKESRRRTRFRNGRIAIGGFGKPMDETLAFHDRRTEQPDFDSLIDLITSTIKPTEWQLGLQGQVATGARAQWRSRGMPGSAPRCAR